MLARLHETSDLLRKISRMQHLTKRLNFQMSGSNHGPDIIKAANCLHELGKFLQNKIVNIKGEIFVHIIIDFIKS